MGQAATADQSSTTDPFTALGDPHRRQIVELLRGGERSVREIADALPVSRPAVSRHLRLLKDAGLVLEQRHGTRHLYRLHDAGVTAVRSYLEQVWGDAAIRFRLAAENTTPTEDVPRTEDTAVASSAPATNSPATESP